MAEQAIKVLENEIRRHLLGRSIENVKQTCDHEEGDLLELLLDDGSEIQIRARRLHLSGTLRYGQEFERG